MSGCTRRWTARRWRRRTRYAPDVTRTLEAIVGSKRAELGRQPTVCVLPFGQLTVPRVDRG